MISYTKKVQILIMVILEQIHESQLYFTWQLIVGIKNRDLQVKISSFHGVGVGVPREHFIEEYYFTPQCKENSSAKRLSFTFLRFTFICRWKYLLSINDYALESAVPTFFDPKIILSDHMEIILDSRNLDAILAVCQPEKTKDILSLEWERYMVCRSS